MEASKTSVERVNTKSLLGQNTNSPTIKGTQFVPICRQFVYKFNAKSYKFTCIVYVPKINRGVTNGIRDQTLDYSVLLELRMHVPYHKPKTENHPE